MIKILITGANSYVGTSVEKWLLKEPEKYLIDTLDMQNPAWKEYDFSGYDVLFHVAGIAHKKISKKDNNLYYSINYQLAINVAEKAFEAKIKHFIFMSSMSVYGMRTGEINQDTSPNPKSHYGISKLCAENYIKDNFSSKMIISIVRPPMIYGYKSPGNYNKLSKFIKKCRFISDFKNIKSVIFIDNFSNFIKIIIDKKIQGIFCPQNDSYMSTMYCCKLILDINKKKYLNCNLVNPFLHLLSSNLLYKIFGNLYYNKEMSNFELNYNKVEFKDSIIISEKGVL